MNAKTDPKRIIATLVRMPADELEQVQAEHAADFAKPGPTYRQSFNAWLVRRIKGSKT